mgnify:FL=1
MNALAINLDPAVMGGAGIVFLVGLGIVFIALVVIILILMLQALIFKNVGKGKKAEKKAAAPAPAPAPVQAAAPAEDDAEIAAVIAAVVAMMSESGNGLKIRSIRRVGKNNTGWNESGRQEYLGTRY